MTSKSQFTRSAIVLAAALVSSVSAETTQKNYLGELTFHDQTITKKTN